MTKEDTQLDDSESEDTAYYHSKIIATALTMFALDGAVSESERACAKRLRARLIERRDEFGGSTWRGDVFARQMLGDKGSLD